MPTNITEAVGRLSTSTSQIDQLHETLSTVGDTLCDRDVVIAIASDAVLADDAFAAIERLSKAVERLEHRLSSVRELSQQIDRLADPLMLGEVR